MSSLDVTKTHVVKELKHDSPIISCRFDPTGKYVFFGAQDYKVWRWDWMGEAKVALDHEAWVRGIACHPQGESVLTAGYDGRLVWWSAIAETPEPLREVAAHDGWVRAIAVSPNGELVATAGNDHKVKLWNFADGTLVREFLGHESHVYNVVFHPDGQSVVSGDLKANLIHWNVETGEQVRKITAEALHKYDNSFLADIGGYRGLTFNASGTRLAGAGITNVTNAFAGIGHAAIVVYDWASGELVMQHEPKAKMNGAAWGVAFHPEDFVIGVSGGGGGGFLLFWKPDAKEEFHQLKLPNNARDLNLSSDGLHVVTGHYDRHIRVSRLTAPAS